MVFHHVTGRICKYCMQGFCKTAGDLRRIDLSHCGGMHMLRILLTAAIYLPFAVKWPWSTETEGGSNSG